MYQFMQLLQYNVYCMYYMYCISYCYNKCCSLCWIVSVYVCVFRILSIILKILIPLNFSKWRIDTKEFFELYVGTVSNCLTDIEIYIWWAKSEGTPWVEVNLRIHWANVQLLLILRNKNMTNYLRGYVQRTIAP